MNSNGTRPKNQANGLLNTHYTDAGIFAQESRVIFQRSWQIVGRLEELAKSGDYLTCTLGGEPGASSTSRCGS